MIGRATPPELIVFVLKVFIFLLLNDMHVWTKR